MLSTFRHLALVRLTIGCSSLLASAACSSSDPGGGIGTSGGSTGMSSGGAGALGGGTNSTGGTVGSGGGTGSGGITGVGGNGQGGSSSGGNANAGGKQATGGVATMGGNANTGGSQATGGVATMGGNASTGGSKATGGVATVGGNANTGGKQATGGAATVGGNANTGGTQTTGGAAAGGKAATGGNPSTGGAPAAGGKAATGGNPSTGGAPATGGKAATGGNPSTGGAPATGGAGAGGTTHTGLWKVMPLGDSITGTTCYPQLTSQTLKNGGHTNFQFVGTNLNNQSCNSAPSLQTEGHGGYFVTYLTTNSPPATGKGTLAELKTWAAEKPDIVLMHFGTNDCWSSVATANILSAYVTVMAEFRSQNPAVIFFVSKIIPMAPSGCSNCASNVTSLNAGITTSWASTNSTTTSPVYIIDHWTGFTPSSDTGDGVHPNVTGAQKMATVTYNALVAKNYF